MPQRHPSILLTLYSLGQGGADRVSAHVARGFAEAGFRTEVVIFGGGGEATETLLPLFGEQVRLTVLGPESGSRTRDLIRRFPAFVRHLKDVRPDCLMSTGNSMNWVSALGRSQSGLRNCRLVLKTTNPIIRSRDTGMRAWARHAGYARAFAAADRVLALSDAETAELAAAFPDAADHFRTVTNPYVTDRMLQSSAKARESRLILGVGRMMPQKRFDLLLRGFAKCQHPDARLTILGDGPDRAALTALANHLGIADRVSMPGFVTNVADWYARASLFALPSVYEGLPAVVLEAMAADCPVISTDCFPAAQELVGRAPGCAIIDPPEPDRLAALIDAQLTSAVPVDVRATALRYSIANGLQSHVACVRDVLNLGRG